MELTARQKELLAQAAEHGVQFGSFPHAQHHKACWKLTDAGLLEFGSVPLSPSDGVFRFLGGYVPGLYVNGWIATDAGRAELAKHDT